MAPSNGYSRLEVCVVSITGLSFLQTPLKMRFAKLFAALAALASHRAYAGPCKASTSLSSIPGEISTPISSSQQTETPATPLDTAGTTSVSSTTPEQSIPISTPSSNKVLAVVGELQVIPGN